jgi:hypothetical protein
MMAEKLAPQKAAQMDLEKVGWMARWWDLQRVLQMAQPSAVQKVQ